MSDLAWAAGFYEGEGSITATGHSLILSVSQVDREPLDRFALIAVVGGVLGHASKTINVFRCYGCDAQRVVMRLWPQLSRRRQDQALRALMRYASRRVRDPERCRRGHRYDAVGVYVDPAGRRECAECRSARRSGTTLPPASLPTAWEARVGVRQYVPAPAAEYRVAVET